MCACVHLPRPTEQMVRTHVYPRRTSAAWIALGGGGKVTSVIPVTPEGQPQPESHEPHWLKGGIRQDSGYSRESRGSLQCHSRGGRLHPGRADRVQPLQSWTRPGWLLSDSGPQAISRPGCTLCPVSLTLSPISPGSPGGPAGPGAPLGP